MTAMAAEGPYTDPVGVAFEVSGSSYTLSERQATALAEKLRLFAAGEFPGDVRLLAEDDASEDWVEGAREAADLIEKALVDELGEPIRLVKGNVADAVYQVLRLSYSASDRAGAAGLWSAGRGKQ